MIYIRRKVIVNKKTVETRPIIIYDFDGTIWKQETLDASYGVIARYKNSERILYKVRVIFSIYSPVKITV